MVEIVRSLVVVLAACGGSSDPPRCACEAPGAVETLGTLPAGLTETSGLAASRAQPGVLFAHNDSGDSARVFALDTTGQLLATIAIAGATNVDWEDIAVGPCAPGKQTQCIYVGDIGDNDGVRDAVRIYRLAEPNVLFDAGPVTLSVTADAQTFVYPDGIHHNAETLLVDPSTADIFVVTKEAAGVPSQVFELPAPLELGTTPTTATAIATLPFPGATEPDVSGGDVSPCGDSILLRLGSAALYELAVPAGGHLADAFAATPRALPIANEPNGEAIAWTADGAAYITTSEGGGEALHRVACR